MSRAVLTGTLMDINIGTTILSRRIKVPPPNTRKYPRPRLTIHFLMQDPAHRHMYIQMTMGSRVNRLVSTLSSVNPPYRAILTTINSMRTRYAAPAAMHTMRTGLRWFLVRCCQSRTASARGAKVMTALAR